MQQNKQKTKEIRKPYQNSYLARYAAKQTNETK